MPERSNDGFHPSYAGFSIMGQTIGRFELRDADVVIRPQISGLKGTDFQDRHMAVLEGEKAVAAALAEIKTKLAKLREVR
jgi:NTE family protein